MNRKNWIRTTERNTLRRTPRADSDAQKVYINELKRDEQLTLVRELVESRGVELCKAYRNVIDVAYGYKSRRLKKPKRRYLVRIPCVIFVVKRKWQRTSDSIEEQKLPAYLFTYWPVKGVRKLCAVPTDVDDASLHAGFKPQALGDEVLVQALGKKSFGSITCAVRRSVFGNQAFALSCRHVFSLSKDLHPREVLGASINLAGKGHAIGESVDVKGELVDGPALSHDAQIAIIKNLSALQEALGDLNVSNIVHSKDEVPDEYDVVVSGKRIRANLRGFFQPSLDYGRPQATDVVHECLILSELTTATEPGHSGAPLLSRDGRNLLIGMHIAGKVDRNGALGLAIPAWHVLDPERYGVPTGVEQWQVFNP